MKWRKELFCTVVGTILVAHLASEARAAGTTDVHKYSVVGTDIEYDESGLPAKLEGVVYYRGGDHDGEVAGTYEEELTPLFSGNTFIGTSGVSEFELEEGEFVSLNVSTIVGFANGALLVESRGQLVKDEGEDHFEMVEGSFTSSSTVILGPDFSMNVDLTLSVSHGSKNAIADEE